MDRGGVLSTVRGDVVATGMVSAVSDSVCQQDCVVSTVKDGVMSTGMVYSTVVSTITDGVVPVAGDNSVSTINSQGWSCASRDGVSVVMDDVVPVVSDGVDCCANSQRWCCVSSQ